MNELIAVVRGEMTRLAKELPEYETVHAMYGVGDTTAAQLIAEIGDIRNFPRRSSLVALPVLTRQWMTPARMSVTAKRLQNAALHIAQNTLSNHDDLSAPGTAG